MPSVPHRLRTAVLIVAVAGVACSTRAHRTVPPPHPPTTPSAAVARAHAAAARTAVHAPTHVAIVVMENHDYGQIIGNPEAPYVNRLARRYGLVTHSYATGHPSLPNYLSLIGGSTFGITTDCTTCHVHARNLIDQLERHGRTWRAYMEGLPHACDQGATYGRYAKKHDPFPYFDDIRASASRCDQVVPLSRLAVDLFHHRLPDFVFVTPNLCHDMHDCSIATGDAFLKRRLPPLLSELGPTGLLFLTWDEGATGAGCCRLAAGGHVATIVAGPGARRGARSGRSYDAYSILRTIELRWGMRLLRGAGCPCTRSLRPFLAS